MNVEEYELTEIDASRVDLVKRPAIRRLFAVAKSEDEQGGQMADEVETIAMPEPTPEVEDVTKSEQYQAIAKQVEALNKANEAKEAQIVALNKAMRMRDLEPLCKSLALDAEVVWKGEQVAPEVVKHLTDKLNEAHEQIQALMKELGKSGDAEPEEDTLAGEAAKIAKSENISMTDALLKVAKDRPDLAAAYRKG